MSMFGFRGSPAQMAAYDMMVLEEIEKENKERALEEQAATAEALAELEDEDDIDPEELED